MPKGGDGTEKEFNEIGQIVKTWRPSAWLDKEVNSLSVDTGASYNAAVCILVFMGLKSIGRGFHTPVFSGEVDTQ